MNRFSWPQKNVLITGASGGIGAATACELAAQGARPILVARRSTELQRVADRILADHGVEALCITADITNQADRERIATFLNANVDELHVLINNAGITAHGRFDESRPEVLRNTMEINFFAAVELTMQLLPLLKKATGAKLIALVSTPSGLYGIPGRFAYSASKAAGHVWLETLATELKAENIHPVIFCPGYTRTELRTSGLAADGSRLVEEPASGARSPEEMAHQFRIALEKKRLLALTNLNGRIV
ncbi:MAG: SDR family NAD(P)-dependent oxidoreductase, partial [Leptospiraceae bacterium]|nr:SDR family NAD(P)-dependent oxidoreductase [Leptospiraceae bacterium]